MKSLAVVGGGVVGLASAFLFARRGWKVTLFDPDRRNNASRACQGISVIKGHRDPRDALFLAKFLGHHGLKQWLKELASVTRKEIRYDFSGVYEPFMEKRDYVFLRERIFHRRWSGLMDFDLFNANEIKHGIPTQTSVLKPLAGGFYFPKDGWFDSDSVLDGLNDALQRLGVSFVEEKVVGIERGDRLRLKTPSDEYQTNHGLIAAGPATAELVQNCNIITANLEQHHGASFRLNTTMNFEADYALTYGKHSLLHQKTQISVGASSWRPGEPQSIDGLSFLKEHLPIVDLSKIQIDSVEVRTGIRVRSKRQTPLVIATGASPKPRLVVMTGFYKNGFQLAHLAAKCLWQLIHGMELEKPFCEFVEFQNN